METINRDAALRFLNALNAHDLSTVEELLAPDVRAVWPRGTIEGRDALMQAATETGPPGTGLQELTVSLADRTIDEVGDTVTTTVRRDYHWKESGDYSHSMLARTALTFPAWEDRRNRGVPSRACRELTAKSRAPWVMMGAPRAPSPALRHRDAALWMSHGRAAVDRQCPIRACPPRRTSSHMPFRTASTLASRTPRKRYTVQSGLHALDYLAAPKGALSDRLQAETGEQTRAYEVQRLSAILRL